MLSLMVTVEQWKGTCLSESSECLSLSTDQAFDFTAICVHKKYKTHTIG